MNFSQFNKRHINHVNGLLKNNTHLFRVNIDPEVIWNLYLDSFPEGTNEIYRQRREFDCSCCRHYVKVLGNVVAYKDGKLISIWNFDAGDKNFQAVCDAMWAAA